MQITRAWTRILLPFQLRPAGASRTLDWDDDLNKLVSTWDHSPGGRRGPHTPHTSYYLEYLPHVQGFLFDGAGQSGCHYLKLADQAVAQLPNDAEVWLGNLHPQTEDSSGYRHSRRGLQLVGVKGDCVWKTPEPFDKQNVKLNLRVSFAPDSGIELWLSRLGVGVLCFSLVCESVGESTDNGVELIRSSLELNHALATAQKAVWLRGTGKQPAVHLHQVARDLLRPLWDRKESTVAMELRGKIFTVIEATIGRDDDTPEPLGECQRQLSQILTHVAQLHPPSHPGEPDEGHVNRLATP